MVQIYGYFLNKTNLDDIYLKIIHINMKNKKLIRLTESDLHRIVKRSVNKVLNEDLEGNELRDYVDSLHLNDNVPHKSGIFRYDDGSGYYI